MKDNDFGRRGTYGFIRHHELCGGYFGDVGFVHVVFIHRHIAHIRGLCGSGRGKMRVPQPFADASDGARSDGRVLQHLHKMHLHSDSADGVACRLLVVGRR